MMKIIYHATIQPHNKMEIERLLQKWLWLVPAWCHILYVNLWDSQGDNCEKIADVKTNYDYRNIDLSLYTCWLDRDDERKESALVHELVHSFTAIVADHARNSFDTLCPKADAEKFNQHLQLELQQRYEASTEDLARAIYERFKGVRTIEEMPDTVSQVRHLGRTKGGEKPCKL